MDLSELLVICKAYNKLGWAVQSQIDNVIDGDVDDCNGSALEMIRDEFLRVVQKCSDPNLTADAAVMVDEINSRIGPH